MIYIQRLCLIAITSTAYIGAFKEPLGLDLVGPFELLNQSLESLSNTSIVKDFKDWRFYYDPPEFQVCFIFLYQF